MAFKTSHRTKKKPGRWSKAGYTPDKKFSCSNCWTKYEMPDKKADGSLYCIQCYMKTGNYHEVKLIKTYKKK